MKSSSENLLRVEQRESRQQNWSVFQQIIILICKRSWTQRMEGDCYSRPQRTVFKDLLLEDENNRRERCDNEERMVSLTLDYTQWQRLCRGVSFNFLPGFDHCCSFGAPQLCGRYTSSQLRRRTAVWQSCPGRVDATNRCSRAMAAALSAAATGFGSPGPGCCCCVSWDSWCWRWFWESICPTTAAVYMWTGCRLQIWPKTG